MSARYGADNLAAHYRHFDTLCSATQDRQDAVIKMMESPPDIMIVIGGYNSSNTNHLARICAQHTKTHHLEDSTCIDPASGTISHKRIGTDEVASEGGWLQARDTEIGLPLAQGYRRADICHPRRGTGPTARRRCPQKLASISVVLRTSRDVPHAPSRSPSHPQPVADRQHCETPSGHCPRRFSIPVLSSP